MEAMLRIGQLLLLVAWLGSLPLCSAFPKPAIQELELKLTPQTNLTYSSGSVKWMTFTLDKEGIIDFQGSCNGSSKLPVYLIYHLLVTPCAHMLDDVDNRTILAKDFTTIGGHNVNVVGTDHVTLQLNCAEGQEQVFNEKEAESVWESDIVYQENCKEPMTINTTAATRNETGKGSQGKRSVSAVEYGKKSNDIDASWRGNLQTSMSALVASGLHARSTRNLYKSAKSNSTEIVCKTRKRDLYAMVFYAATNDAKANVTVTINVNMKNSWGHLSALDYPNLAFYAIMTVVYSLFALAWLLALVCQHKDLLRVQFWIGAVIALSMIEMVFFFSQYNTVNVTGEEGFSLLMTAELVSAAKRTLARLLVIIISLGCGIVKPGLGPNLILVTGIGVVFFTVAAVEGISRTMGSSEEINSTKGRVVTLAMVVLDVGIIYFVYASITDTMRTLRLHRNTVMLSLYRHFSNAIIFAVVASCTFLVWDFLEYPSSQCIQNWQDIWLLDGFWHIIFCYLLLAMMVLWRPSASNNRCAYSPLIDLGSNNEPEQMPSEAFEGMKLHNLGQERKTVPSTSVDDDLKWVEENIPTSLVDAAVPVLMDSEDKINISRFEVSKMQ